MTPNSFVELQQLVGRRQVITYRIAWSLAEIRVLKTYRLDPMSCVPSANRSSVPILGVKTSGFDYPMDIWWLI
jgi:hypothetical protein